MRRYVNEFVFRFSEGKVRKRSPDRLNYIIQNAVGKRLTYGDLTQQNQS